METRALIIGGGIGGLAAAIALRQAGCAVTVFERAAELRELGAGLSIWSNGVRSLRRLGVEERALAGSSQLDRFEVRTWQGDVLTDTRFGEYGARYGAPNVCLSRAEMLRALAGGVPSEDVRLSAECSGFAEDADRVRAILKDGTPCCGAFLVGADGIHSVIRRQRFGDRPPRYAGYTCWRALATCPHPGPPGYGFESWGPGQRFAVLPCGPGRVAWYATRNAPEGAADAPAGRKQEVVTLFAGWHPPIPQVLEATAEEAILRNDIVDRPPLRHWGSGRVTLLGDAAHATTPNFGQGAAMAMEDALVLAHCLPGAAPVEAALREYEALRAARTAAIVRHSWWLGWFAQWENPLAIRLRDRLMRSGLLRGLAARRFEAMVGYDPPAP